ncbi:hypothetical protein HYDPIDRAFT_164425 [Hydnomerulius pinastri MD-312]|nr:hypothetical protein HYDPIDRAFT_164425 [Hydnomerulius pinastri MD-312]
MYIRCQLEHQGLWRALADGSNDELARQVHTLEILNEEPGGMSEAMIPEIVPLGIGLGTTARCNHYDSSSDGSSWASLNAVFCLAISKMGNLQNFVWKRSWGAPDNVYKIVGSRNLKSLRIIDRKGQLSNERKCTLSALESPEFLAIRNLTAFDFATYCICNPEHEEDGKRLVALLGFLEQNSGTLVILNLAVKCTFDEATISKFLENVYFPRLRELTLEGTYCNPSSLSRFLIKHDTVEALRLPVTMPGRRWEEIQIPENALPRLEWLSCAAQQVVGILQHGAGRRIKYIGGVNLHEMVNIGEAYEWSGWPDSDDEEAWENDLEDEPEGLHPSPWRSRFMEILRSRPGITHVAVHEYDSPRDLEILATVAPQLTWIDAGSCRESKGLDGLTLGDWARGLSAFKHLQTINQHPFLEVVYDVKTEEASTEEALRLYSTSCPSLQTLERWGEVYVFHRNSDDLDVTWNKVKRETSYGNDEGGVTIRVPSMGFVRATLRRIGGPCCPGPIAEDVFW